MKNFFLQIFLFTTLTICNAQINGNFCGIYFPVNLNSQNPFGFCTVDTSGEIYRISTSSVSNIHGFGGNAVDAKHNKYFLVATDSMNMYLMQFDLLTGNMDTILFEIDSLNDGHSSFISGNMSDVFYNCKDNSVYFQYILPNLDSLGHPHGIEYLGKINLNTKVFNNIINLTTQEYSGYQQYVDLNHQKIYLFHTFDLNTLICYDLNTGIFSSVHLNVNFTGSMELSLTLNPNDNELYGLLIDESNFPNTFTFQNRVIKINPIDGNVTYLSSVFNGVCDGNIVFNATHDKMIFSGGNSLEKLVTFNLIDHSITTADLHNSYNDHNIFGLNSLSIPKPDSNFTTSDFCQNAPTKFYSQNNSVYHEWNFDDPQSGTDNISTLSNPVHIFSSPGIYNVEMTSLTCDETITTTEQITISPFPAIDIGNDTTICINRTFSPITYIANAPASTYLWQDNNTGNSITVNSPGTYWVNIMSSCGIVSDTVKITGTVCQYQINLKPNLTSGIISISTDYELSNSSFMTLEIFDVFGRLIFSKNIFDNESEINVEDFSNGSYFYRFSNSDKILKSGKIILEK